MEEINGDIHKWFHGLRKSFGLLIGEIVAGMPNDTSNKIDKQTSHGYF